MKVAISMDVDKISNSFENCKYFLIVRIEDNEVRAQKLYSTMKTGENPL